MGKNQLECCCYDNNVLGDWVVFQNQPVEQTETDQKGGVIVMG